MDGEDGGIALTEQLQEEQNDGSNDGSRVEEVTLDAESKEESEAEKRELPSPASEGGEGVFSHPSHADDNPINGKEEKSELTQVSSETENQLCHEMISEPQEDKDEGGSKAAGEKEAVDPKTPVSILKKSEYVVAEQEEAASSPETEKLMKSKGITDKKKSVYIWQLVSRSINTNHFFVRLKK